ncbi:MAG: hypothetical protein CVT99_00810 [Bacteroidetes bacterium HGW-Bacteroidetes-16]|jgi:alpha-amylase|nr:MAG: hypothetical protein CVT99_00810 [Bacteroidetes bacterium HGW-Bacteroidetes-16]
MMMINTTKIYLCAKIHIPVILRNFRFFEINNSNSDYHDKSIDYLVKKLCQDNLLPFFETIRNLTIESDFRFKAGVSISGIALKLLQNIAPHVIKVLEGLKKLNCIEFLSEPWSHSMIAFANEETLERQINLHDETIHYLFGSIPDVFILHSPVCPEKIINTILNYGKKAVFANSNHIGQEKIKQNENKNNSPRSSERIYLIHHILSQILQDMDPNAKGQQLTDFASFVLNNIKIHSEDSNLLIFIYNPAQIKSPFNEHLAAAWKMIMNQILSKPEYKFCAPSEISKTVRPLLIKHKLTAKEGRPIKLPTDLWHKNVLQKHALQQQFIINKAIKDCCRSSLVEEWNLIQDMENLYYMNNQFFSEEYHKTHFNPFNSPYLAYTNYMNILADFASRLKNKSHPVNSQVLSHNEFA